MPKPYRIVRGDCLHTLRRLPAQSVHCVVTSPPYFWQRDYGTGKWRGGNPRCRHQLEPQQRVCRCGATYRDRQVGLETTPEGFAHKLVKIFREVRRVLRDDGVAWLNLGDSYAAQPTRRKSFCKSGKSGNWGLHGHVDGSLIANRRPKVAGIKKKDLIGIPWLVAFALREDGWYLRSDIIWAKGVSFCPTYVGGTMPSAIKDRPTKSHEYLFLLTKTEHYFYDKYAIAEKSTYAEHHAKYQGTYTCHKIEAMQQSNTPGRDQYQEGLRRPAVNPQIRNARTVWTIPLEPSREEHYAQFPQKLVEPCIKAGTSEQGCCPKCGAPWVRVVKTSSHGQAQATDAKDRRGAPNVRGKSIQSAKRVSNRVFSSAQLYGWKPSCKCGRKREPVPCTVLDPFSGSGTTGIVALQLHRRYIGTELSRKYVRVSRHRLRRAARSARAQLTPLFNH